MEDERLIQLALEHKFVSEVQLERARRARETLSDRGVDRTVWFMLMDLGYVSDEQARSLRKFVSSASVRALEVDGYTIEGRIGSGGMGDVFRARNATGDEAAVKLLARKLARSDEHARRFQREARASMRLKHPHITQSLSAGEIEGQRYLVMELVKGPSLKQWLIEHGHLSEEQGMILLFQLSHALRYAWGHGVLHRDVKPANLMIAPPRIGVEEPFCAKLCDFGLAKVWQTQEEPSDDSRGGLTGTGMALGTPHYMAPEQASGETDLDQRADIYSLGASIYHAALGHTMFSGKSSTIIMYKQVTEAVDLAPLKTGGFSEGFVKLLGRMLDKSRKNRFATWDEVLADLERLAPDVVARQRKALDGAVSDTFENKAAANAPIQMRPPASDEHPPSHAHSPDSSRIAQPAPAGNHTTGPLSPGPAAAAVRRPAWRRVGIPLFVMALCILAGAGGLLAAMRAGTAAAIRVTPATFANTIAALSVNAQNNNGSVGDIVLETGDYYGPWRFGVAQSGLTLRAAGAGVRVVAAHPGSQNDAALVRLEPGLKHFQMQGLTITNSSGVALEALVGAEATLVNVNVDGAIAVSGAQLFVSALHVQSPTVPAITVDNRGHLVLEDSIIQGNVALLVKDGHAQVRRSWLCTSASETVARADAGQLEIDAAVLTAASGSAVQNGLILGSDSSCSLKDVSITGVKTGLCAESAKLSAIDGLTLEASDVGITWSGPRDAAWIWQRVLVRAPRVALGLKDFLPGGDGARSERLAQVPMR